MTDKQKSQIISNLMTKVKETIKKEMSRYSSLSPKDMKIIPCYAVGVMLNELAVEAKSTPHFILAAISQAENELNAIAMVGSGDLL